MANEKQGQSRVTSVKVGDGEGCELTSKQRKRQKLRFAHMVALSELGKVSLANNRAHGLAHE